MKSAFIIMLLCLSVCSMEGDTFVVTSKSDSGPGTLRQAILDSNATLLSTANVITFNLPLTGPLPLSISVSTVLPTITRPVNIAGDTQPGSLATRPVIDVTTVSVSAPGLTINTTNCTVRRLAIYGFGHQGILLVEGGNHLIAGNHIGINTNGNIVGAGNAFSGIWINNSVGNIIGGTTEQDRNVISENGYNGIYIDGGSASNRIIGNYIGVNPFGISARGNEHCGIKINNGDYNQIGGVNPGEGNLISGNLGALTLDESGSFTLGSGMQLQGFPFCNYATGNSIQGNLIGTDEKGLVAIGNLMGIRMGQCEQTLVGGDTDGARNIVSGNTQNGIGFHPYGFSRHNTIQGNYIGTDKTGGNPLGNGSDGIQLNTSCAIACGGTFTSVVGGTNSPGQANIIAYNGANGVAGSECLSILGNSIHANGMLGIDHALPLGLFTPNDFMDTDAFQNFPVLTRATSDSFNIFISGTLNSKPSRQYRLQFFRNIFCDHPNNHGEGKHFIGEQFVTTDVGGNASFSVTFPFILSGEVITATATSPEGSTSEFSTCGQLRFPPTLTIVRSGSTAIISWLATSGSAWVLQRSPTFSPLVWEDVPATPVLVGSRYQITVPIADARYFYRLRST